MKKKKAFGSFSACMMLSPALLLLIVVSIYPFLWLMRYVLYDYDSFNTYFIGFKNFTRAFGDKLFWDSVLHTCEYAALKLVFILPLSLFLAYLMTWKMRGSKILQGIYFLPTVISSAIYGMIFYFIYATFNGVLNALLMKFGFVIRPIDWLGDPAIVMPAIVVVAIWGGFGNYMMLFMSGLLGISSDVYESAKIDGANAWQSFYRIALPLLGPVLKVVLMIAITTAFKDYETILVMTGGGPNHRTDVMFSYIYQLSFGSASSGVQLGYSSVLSLISACIIGVITLVYMRISRKLDELY